MTGRERQVSQADEAIGQGCRVTTGKVGREILRQGLILFYRMRLHIVAMPVLYFGDNSGILGVEADRVRHVSKSSWPEMCYVAQVHLEVMSFFHLPT